MKTVSILGWYGHNNLGDQLILDGLKNLFNGWVIKVYSDTATSSYPQLDIEEVNQGDLFVLGGGELIHRDRLYYYSPHVKHTNIPPFIHRWFFNQKWSDKIHVPKILLGCGLDSFDGAIKETVVRMLNGFSFIGVRDDWSIKQLKEMGVNRAEYFPDLSFASQVHSYNFVNQDLAVVCPTDRLNKYVATNSKGWLATQLRGFREVMFVPFGSQDNDDYTTCLELAKTVKNSVVLKPEDVSVERVVGLFSCADVVVCYRLHSMLLSFMLGKRFVYWPYHPKLIHMAECLKGKSFIEQRQQQLLRFNEVMQSLSLETKETRGKVC